MFSVDDPLDELSEEDFLQAALDLEGLAVPVLSTTSRNILKRKSFKLDSVASDLSPNSNFDLPPKEPLKSIAATNTSDCVKTLTADSAKAQTFGSSCNPTFQIGSQDSGDSDLDLSLSLDKPQNFGVNSKNATPNRNVFTGPGNGENNVERPQSLTLKTSSRSDGTVNSHSLLKEPSIPAAKIISTPALQLKHTNARETGHLTLADRTNISSLGQSALPKRTVNTTFAGRTDLAVKQNTANRMTNATLRSCALANTEGNLGPKTTNVTTSFQTPLPNRTNTLRPEQMHIHTDLSVSKYETNDSPGDPLQRRGRKRKFPGPAGVLPKLQHGISALTDKIVPDDSPKTPSRPKAVVNASSPLPSSQSVDSLADQLSSYPPWCRMKDDLEPQALEILREYNLAAVLRKGRQKQLVGGKVPVICVLIDSLDIRCPDASAVLKDISGTMQGTIHRQLIKEYPEHIVNGSVLVLRQVAVFTPSSRTSYLNITPANLVRIYPKDLTTNRPHLQLSSFCPEDFTVPTPVPPCPSTMASTTRHSFRASPSLMGDRHRPVVTQRPPFAGQRTPVTNRFQKPLSLTNHTASPNLNHPSTPRSQNPVRSRQPVPSAIRFTPQSSKINTAGFTFKRPSTINIPSPVHANHSRTQNAETICARQSTKSNIYNNRSQNALPTISPSFQEDPWDDDDDQLDGLLSNLTDETLK